MDIQSSLDQSSLEKELQTQRRALLAHAEAMSALAQAENEEELISGVCKAIASQDPYVLAWVGTAENDPEKTIRFLGSYGLEQKYLQDLVVSWGENTPSGNGPGGTCIRTNKSIVIEDIETDVNFAPWCARAKLSNIRSLIGVPITSAENKPIAALLVYSRLPGSFGDAQIILFESFAKEIGFGLGALKKQKLLEDVIQKKNLAEDSLGIALRATIEAMSKTMEWRDPYTAGHQKRVALIAEAIAGELGWSEDEKLAVYLAGLVHDIGKISVPSEILTKPSKLSSLEMLLVGGHVEAGYQILKDIPFPWPIAKMIQQHHERLDGSGYPNKLSGDEICMGARVLAVADTIEAMATHRPYRAALGLSAAMQTLQDQAGISIDENVLDAAFRLMDEQHTLEKLIQS